MKRNILKTAVILTSLALIIFSPSCNRHNNNPAGCSGTITATWNEGGATYSQYNSVTAGVVGSYMQLVFAACSSDGIDRTVAFNFIPYPPVAGTYPIRYKSGHGWLWNGTMSGTYAVGNTTVHTYLTDSTTHTGNFVISSVNTTDKTFSGAFDFTAIDDAGTATAAISNGSYTVKYP